jgi:uncharacterized protein (DUF4415 family)
MKREPKKMISLRLPASLIEDLKLLAKLQGIRYQTLVNRVLRQWAKEAA